MHNIYSNIELVIKIEPKNSTTNTANYKKLSNWSGSVNGNVTTTGLNGNGSAYGMYDMAGQVYEWTDSCPSSSLGVPYSSLFKSGASLDNQNIRILRGGSFADNNHNNLSKSYSKNFDILSMIDYGCMGFRVANNEPSSSSRPLDADSDYTLISNTGNSPDDCEYGLDAKLGQVNYLYNIQNQLITNNEYCTYLNTIDPSGNKQFQIYDDRMLSSAVGGIEYNSCANTGSMYYVKDNFSNKPVTFVKWVMAAQYCNWLTNNKSSNILSITSGSYDTASLYNNSISISGCYRQDTAKYFLPSENEWYKAAYYDPSNGKYWNYPTQSDEPPTAIICDAQGNRVSSENQSETEKIIPIVFVGDNIINESNFQDIKYLIENSIDSNSYNRYNETLSKNYCPSVNIQAHYITANNSSGIYIVPLVASMSNLNIGQKYSYNFSSAGSNWPSRIYPFSGSFTASSDEFQLPAILKLKPNDIYETTSFTTNLEYNHLEQDELRIYKDIDIYNNIKINLMTDNCSDCSDNVRVVVDQNALPTISQLDKAGIYFQSSSLSKNAINISGGLCDQYVPLIMNVSNPEPGKIYSFTLSFWAFRLDCLCEYVFTFSIHSFFNFSVLLYRNLY
jgi:formylglycine-generating enzyme required for sulfatase activity